MADEWGAELAEGGDYVLDVKEPLCRQYRVVRLHGVAFAHDELIPARIVHILRADIHLIKVDLRQDLHNTHVAADVPGFSLNDHVNYIFS